ncbi:unnamed protein product, partial [Didymodactylos carnosus]
MWKYYMCRLASELEEHECDNSTQYRCKNGLCIDKHFLVDSNFDCLDRSYEVDNNPTATSHSLGCQYNPSMKCEEYNCAWLKFSCGDGSCQKGSLRGCANERSGVHEKNLFRFDENINTIDNMSLTCRKYRTYARERYVAFHLSAEVCNQTFSICYQSSSSSSKLYQCNNSNRFVSEYRINDGTNDCYFNDDEKVNDTCQLNLTFSFQCKTSSTQCIDSKKLFDKRTDCIDRSDELLPLSCTKYNDLDCRYIQGEQIPSEFLIFQKLCDGISDRDLNGTNETNCHSWQCSCRSKYVMCDGVWNCLDGRDELNCDTYKIKNCSSDEHYCFLLTGKQLTCLN